MKGPPAVRPKLVPPWYCFTLYTQEISFNKSGFIQYIFNNLATEFNKNKNNNIIIKKF